MHVINESSSVVLAPTKQCLQSETMQLPSSGGNLIECINSTMDAAVPDAHTDKYALKASNKLLRKGKQPICYLQSVSKNIQHPRDKATG